MSKCNCVYEEFCSMINGKDIVLPKPCEYRKDDTDFVAVVRCENCEYCEKIYPVKNKNEEPQAVYYCRSEKCDKKPTDFCSYGKRKGD